MVRVGRAGYEVENPDWRDKAECLGAPWSDFELNGEGEANKGNVLYRAMKHCVACIVRDDCVIEALSTRDTGIIRGGIKFHDKMRYERCTRCRLPVADDSGVCTFCASLRDCERCGREFAAMHTWLKVSVCQACTKAERKANRPRRFKLRKPKPRVIRLRRRKR